MELVLNYDVPFGDEDERSLRDGLYLYVDRNSPAMGEFGREKTTPAKGEFGKPDRQSSRHDAPWQVLPGLEVITEDESLLSDLFKIVQDRYGQEEGAFQDRNPFAWRCVTVAVL